MKDFIRFMGKVPVQAALHECWEWTGSRSGDGYGFFRVQGKTVKAHRWIYKQVFADPIDGSGSHGRPREHPTLYVDREDDGPVDHLRRLVGGREAPLGIRPEHVPDHQLGSPDPLRINRSRHHGPPLVPRAPR